MVAEGVRTTETIYMLAKKLGVSMPITEQVYNVLYNDVDPRTALLQLMLRELKHEWSYGRNYPYSFSQYSDPMAPPAVPHFPRSGPFRQCLHRLCWLHGLPKLHNSWSLRAWRSQFSRGCKPFPNSRWRLSSRTKRPAIRQKFTLSPQTLQDRSGCWQALGGRWSTLPPGILAGRNGKSR